MHNQSTPEASSLIEGEDVYSQKIVSNSALHLSSGNAVDPTEVIVFDDDEGGVEIGDYHPANHRSNDTNARLDERRRKPHNSSHREDEEETCIQHNRGVIITAIVTALVIIISSIVVILTSRK